MKLPSCPDAARFDRVWELSGRGRGHGLGLNVEQAKKSQLSADEILAEAYDAAP